MKALAIPGRALPAPTEETLRKIMVAEQRIREREQISVATEHILHAGMYARTVRLAAGVVIVSVLIKVPTMLIVQGNCYLLAGDEWRELEGFNVIPTSPMRKSVYVTRTDTAITMIFPTDARTVEEAEAQFTDEADGLLSRQQADDDLILITGAEACQV